MNRTIINGKSAQPHAPVEETSPGEERILRTVNGYDLIAEIGSGGMSRVYRARRASDGDVVALKVIPIDNMAADFEARLHREPEIQQGIGHENIVRLIESFRDGDQYFLAMEYVDGRSLAQMLYQESGPLPFERARRYFRQVLRGVEHLHRLGIVHRDIKPSNILIRWDDVVKLADFGIAKFAWQGDQTATRLGLGTPEYMSPEQVRGAGIDHRTDIYSLGITLFEMLTARRPFSHKGDTPMAYAQVIQDVLRTPLPDPRSYNPSISYGAVEIIKIATAKESAQRFQNCAEMIEAIDAAPKIDPEPATVVGPLSGGATMMREPTMYESFGSPGPGMLAGNNAGTGADRSQMNGPFDEDEMLAIEAPSTPRSLRDPNAPGARSGKRTIAYVVSAVLLLVLGIGAYAIYGASRSDRVTGGEESSAQEVVLSDVSAWAIAEAMAGRYERHYSACDVAPLAQLYAKSNVRYFDLADATREDVEREVAKRCAAVQKMESVVVKVDSAWAGSEALEMIWRIETTWLDRNGQRLRESTADLVRFGYRDNEWAIIEQRHMQTSTEKVADIEARMRGESRMVTSLPQTEGIGGRQTGLGESTLDYGDTGYDDRGYDNGTEESRSGGGAGGGVNPVPVETTSTSPSGVQVPSRPMPAEPTESTQRRPSPTSNPESTSTGNDVVGPKVDEVIGPKPPEESGGGNEGGGNKKKDDKDDTPQVNDSSDI